MMPRMSQWIERGKEWLYRRLRLSPPPSDPSTGIPTPLSIAPHRAADVEAMRLRQEREQRELEMALEIVKRHKDLVGRLHEVGNGTH